MKTVPTFIGAGATKSGSSWVYANLASHPKIHAPVKEVRYFNKHVDKGFTWYQGLFEDYNDAVHCGEFTPSYLYDPDIPKAISKKLPDVKLLFILRNPVHRSYSQYKSRFHTGQTKCGSFEEFLVENPESLERGYYFRHLKPWYEYFDSQNIKIFIFEESTNSTDHFKNELGEFLGVDPIGFSHEALTTKANASSAPRLKKLYQFGFVMSQFARENRLYGISRFINRVGSKIFNFLGEGRQNPPPLKEEHYQKLITLYENDIKELSKLMGRSKTIWT